METKLIDTGSNATTEFHTSKFDALSYIGLQVLVTAKKASNVISNACMGNVRVNFRGNDIINGLYSQISAFSNRNFGSVEDTQGASGAYSYYGCFIPFFHKMLPNAIHKAVGDSMNFYIEASKESVDESTVEVYGVIDDIPERYVPTLLVLAETAPKSKIMLELNNLATLMISAPASSVFTQIELFIANKLKYVGTWNILKGLSNAMTQVETGLNSLYLDLVNKGIISEALSDSAHIISTGGSGAFYYTTLSLAFNSAKTTKTTQAVSNKIQAQLQNQLKSSGTSEGVKVAQEVATQYGIDIGQYLPTLKAKADFSDIQG